MSVETIRKGVIDRILEIEGGFSDRPSDSGGATNFGITERVARKHGYLGGMIALPEEFARQIYTIDYWDGVQGDRLALIGEPLVNEVVDTAVNMGVYRASEFLQRALNVLNQQEKIYPDLKIDGLIGTVTVAALVGYINFRDLSVLVKALNCLQGAFYIELAERRVKDESSLYGWIKNRVVI